jgi:hypothetical protein
MHIFLSEKSCPKILVIPPNLIYISGMINELNIRKANKSRISKKIRKKHDHIMNGQKNRAFMLFLCF